MLGAWCYVIPLWGGGISPTLLLVSGLAKPSGPWAASGGGTKRVSDSDIQVLKYSLHCFTLFQCQLQIGTCQGHLPSASAETEPCVAAAVDLQHALKGAQGGEMRHCVLQGNRWNGVLDRYFQELIS